MIDVGMSNNLKVAYALVFELVSHDACIDSVLPLRIAQECVEVMELTLLNVNDINSINEFAFKLKMFCSEFSQLISRSIAEYGYFGNDVLHLIWCCAEIVIKIHLSGVPPEPASPTLNTYNPGKYGRAYYFTEHGCQLRKMRRFNVDKREL